MQDLKTVHQQMLERWRNAMNLVGPNETADFHIEDCDKALAALEPQGLWADLGSGAGFPGLVFAARFPEVELELVDSRWKRCVFLEEVLANAGRLDGPVTVRCIRVEQLEANRYDGVLARGFAPPESTIATARRLLKRGGLCVLLLQAYTDLPPAPGFTLVQTHPYTVRGKARKTVVLRAG